MSRSGNGCSTALICGGLIVVWRLWKRDQLGMRARLFTLLVMLAMVGTLSYGVHLGGRLVYEFGVGGTFGDHESTAEFGHSHDHAH